LHQIITYYVFVLETKSRFEAGRNWRFKPDIADLAKITSVKASLGKLMSSRA